MATTQGVKLDAETRKRLDDLAAKRDRSPHWIMCTAIKEYVEREENYEREKQEDRESWEDYLLTGEAIAHDKVAAWLKTLAEGKLTPPPEA